MIHNAGCPLNALYPASPPAVIPVRFGDTPEKPSKTKPKKAFRPLRMLAQAVLGLYLLTGAGAIYTTMRPDPPLPTLNTIAPGTFRLYKNSTRKITPDSSRQERFEALAPTREILKTLSPEITQWFEEAYKAEKIQFGIPSYVTKTVGKWPVAFYNPASRTLYLSEYFWTQSDGLKATTLVHEFRHSQQRFSKIATEELAKTLSGKNFTRHSYDSNYEAEAFLYEAEAYKALGLLNYRA